MPVFWVGNIMTPAIPIPSMSGRYIYLHLGDFYGKCREIYHTWMVWDI